MEEEGWRPEDRGRRASGAGVVMPEKDMSEGRQVKLRAGREFPAARFRCAVQESGDGQEQRPRWALTLRKRYTKWQFGECRL